jgi:asparagine synthase (glutamine-hydrolysing)
MFDAVALRLKAAERSAFTLSGGMDSSSVLAAAVHTTGAKQHAFSSVYIDKTYDESEEIRTMLAEAAEEWHPVTVGTPDVLGLVRRMIDVHEEPVATATWLAHFLLCQEAARLGFGSLFGGLGGDELNAGEYEHFFYFFADLRATGDEERLRREIAMWVRYHDHPIFRKNPAVAEEALARLVDLSRPGFCRVDRRRLEKYAAALAPNYFDLQHFEPVMEHPFRSYLKNRTYQDLTRETIPCCLRAENRQAAAFGMDNFLPFFDHRLVELLFQVPGTLKYRDGVTKHLLRQAMRGVLPEPTRTRIKKTGWNAPAHVWFAGAGREPLMDLLRSRAFRERGIYHVPEVLRLADEHEEIVCSGRAQEHHMMFFWQLVNLELWLQSLDET